MDIRNVRLWLAFGVGLVAAPLEAQQLPPGVTPEQAAQLVQQRPELGGLLRQRMNQSGLSPEQIRSRLRAAGLPTSLLDQYLTQDSTGLPDPGQNVLRAVSQLGVAHFTRQDSLLLTQDSTGFQLLRDSLRLDSIAREDSLINFRGGLRLFGLDVFKKPTTQFLPIVTGPVDDTYLLGPGDVLVLILTGEVEAAYSLEVTREGFIVIPEAGQVFVNNLTLRQLREVTFTRLNRVYSGLTRSPTAKTRFEITVARVRVTGVRVVGDVSRPGTYQVSATGGVLSALYEAAGLTERGNFRSIELRRGATLLGTIDLYDYLVRGSTPAGTRLDGGDVVFVPPQGARVKITGAVTRPGIYEMKPGETVADLVRFAGGLQPDAELRTATIDRIMPSSERPDEGPRRTVVTVDLRAALDSTRPGVPLAAGDSLAIFTISGARGQAVSIEGSVWQPGRYRLNDDMRLSDLIRIAGGLRPETYRGRAQILRVRPDSTRELIGASLDGGDDPALRELDRVTIYARTDFRPERYVGVYGAVRNPGRYSFADSLTLKDAILLAGGTTESADLAEAEVSRPVLAPSGIGDSIATVLLVPLDSSYVVDPTGYVARPVGRSGPVVRLAPYDNVMVRRQQGWESPREVVLAGEVRSPGRYTLRSKDERLADLIARSGGLTAQADPNGVRFFRNEDAAFAAPWGNRDALRRAAGTRRAEADSASRPLWGAMMTRVGVDLPRALRNPGSRSDIVLINGDSIHIPTFSAVVRVEGSVNAPTAVAYRPGAGIPYYVAAAGGYSRLADRRGTFVQQPNGMIEKRGDPGAGAVVVVPAREAPPPSQFNLGAILGLVGQLIAAATTIAVVIVSQN